MIRTLLLSVTVLLGSALASGCGPSPEQIANGDDPLRALESSARSTKYDAAYWAEEARAASSTWNDAIDKCGDPKWSATPNCNIVREQQVEAEAEAEEDAGGEMPEEEVAPDDLGEDVSPGGADAEGAEDEEPAAPPAAEEGAAPRGGESGGAKPDPKSM